MAEPSAFEVELVTEKLKDKNQQVLIKFQQNWLKKEAGQFVLRPRNLNIVFGIRRNCPRSGRSQSMYLFTRRVIKQTLAIIKEYPFC